MHSRRVLTFALIAAFIAVSLVLGSIPQARAATTIYVDDSSSCVASCGGSWATAYPDLRQALTASVSGDQIWVAAGVYYPDVNGATNSNNINDTFTLKAGVAVYGGFDTADTLLSERNLNVNRTILSGDITQNDDASNADGNFINESYTEIVANNSLHVISGTGLNSGTILDSFIITAGDAAGANNGGGGIRISGGTPILDHLIVLGNRSQNCGGGIEGFATSAVNMSVRNSFIGGNFSTYGGGVCWNLATGTADNVVLSGNTASQWGGGLLSVTSTGVVVTNVTASGNSAGVNGDALHFNGTGLVRNSILWGNTGPGTTVSTIGAGPTVSYSDVEGGFTGTGNVNVNPLFVDANGADNVFGTIDDNLRIQVTSPASILDGGNNAVVTLPTDFDGLTRIMDGPDVDTTATVDMGAFEVLALVAPTITSANNATFYEGGLNSFTVTATGTPSTMTYGLMGTLPAGVTFNPTTGVLSGTLVAGTSGSYPVTITASNGIAPDASQNFTLTVQKAHVVGEPAGNKSCAKMGSTVNIKLRGMTVGRQYTYTMEVRDGSTVYMTRQFTMTFAGPAGTQTNFKWIMFPVNDVPALNAPRTYWNAWTSLPASVELVVTGVDRTTNLRTQSVMTYTCADGLVSAPVATFTPNVTGAPYAP